MDNNTRCYDGNTEIDYYLYCNRKLTNAHRCFRQGHYYPVYNGGFYTEESIAACGEGFTYTDKFVHDRAKYNPVPKDKIVKFINLNYDVDMKIIEVNEYNNIKNKKIYLLIKTSVVMVLLYFILNLIKLSIW